MGFGGGDKGGGGGGDVNPFAIQQATLARRAYDAGTPLRNSLIGTTMSAFGLNPSWEESAGPFGLRTRTVTGQVIPGLFSATPAERAAIESQYTTASENLRNTIGSRGSFYDRFQTDIEENRAESMANLIGMEKQRALAMAVNLLGGNAQGLQAGLGAASNASIQQNQFAAQQAAMANSGMMNFGLGLGGLMTSPIPQGGSTVGGAMGSGIGSAASKLGGLGKMVP